MENMVKDWVSRDPFGYGYLLDFYQRGAQVRWMDEAGLVLRDDRYGISYTGGDVPADLPELNGPGLVLTDSSALAEQLSAAHPDWLHMEFSQAYYLRKEPPRVQARPGVSIRPLTLEDMDFVLENYHNPGAYESHIRQRIAEGMLEVLPQFRRRGLAEVLEAALIAQQLERGRFPYCHVRHGNAASEALQKKLGLTFDENRTLYWLG